MILLAGCDNPLQSKEASCFSISQNTGNQPFSPIMINQCTGESWLLVKSNFTKNPEDGYTYVWLILDRNNYANPNLVSR